MEQYSTLDERVESLETILGEFIVETRIGFKRLNREMKSFKDEMKDFKDEMKDFKNEMTDFKEQSLLNFKQVNKQWGELANKMGSLVEDIISPAVKPVVMKYFNDEIIDFSVNRKKNLKEKNIKGEFDVIGASETAVYLVEVKSTPQLKHLDDIEKLISNFKILFPEYGHLNLRVIVAALRLDDDFVNRATELGYYAMAYREWEYMDILNFDSIK